MDNKPKTLGTWERYKLGQAQFTNWLTRTAGNVQPKSQANARHIIARGRLRLNELEPLAKIVADGYKPAEIPYTPIVVLRDVVELRKQSGRYFARIARGADDESLNEGLTTHAHTITVLEKVLKILENAVASVKHKFLNEPYQDVVANMFGLLRVQVPKDAESEEEDLGGISTKPKKPKKPKKSKKGSKKNPHTKKKSKTAGDDTDWIDHIIWIEEDDDDRYEYYMLIYCFFADFNKIRDYVAELWCDYFYDKSKHNITLAVVHDAACQLFALMGEDLRRALKKNGWSDKNHRGHMETLVAYKDEPLSIDAGEGSGALGNLAPLSQDTFSWLAFNADVLSENMLKRESRSMATRKSWSSSSLCIKDGASDAYQLLDFSNQCTRELRREIDVLRALKETKVEFGVIPAETHLLVELQRMMRKRTRPSSAVFSLQLYLDMRHILEDQVSYAFEAMHKRGKELREKLQRHLDTSEDIDLQFFNDYGLSFIDRYVVQDFTFAHKSAKCRTDSQEAPEKFALLKRDPVWSGLLELRARLYGAFLGWDGLISLPGFLRLLGFYYLLEHRVPAWPHMTAFYRLHHLSASNFLPAGSAGEISSYIKYSRGNYSSLLWDLIRQTFNKLKLFYSRYLKKANSVNDHNSLIVDYFENMRPREDEPVLAQIDQWTLVPGSNLPPSDEPEQDNKPWMHIEVLEGLTETTEEVCRTALQMDYLQLLQEARVICKVFREQLESQGVVEEGDDEWEELSNRADVKDLVEQALTVAIVRGQVERLD